MPKDFDSMKIDYMGIRMAQIANYLGLAIDEYLCWNAHLDDVFASLVKYLGFLITSNRLLLHVLLDNCSLLFINSRINYSIEVYDHCANEYLSKLIILKINF